MGAPLAWCGRLRLSKAACPSARPAGEAQMLSTVTMETHQWSGGCHLTLQAWERLGSNSILVRIRLLVPAQAGKQASVSQSSCAPRPKLSVLLLLSVGFSVSQMCRRPHHVSLLSLHALWRSSWFSEACGRHCLSKKCLWGPPLPPTEFSSPANKPPVCFFGALLPSFPHRSFS